VGKILFKAPGEAEPVEFYVLEQARINGIDYLLVTEEESGDCTAYILKEVAVKDSADTTEEDTVYEMVESDEELEYMSKIFASVLDDVDLEM
jgi:hypothetical protein